MAYKLKRVFLYAIPSIFLMSHIIVANASAADTVYTLNGYSVVNSAGSLKMNCTFSDASNHVVSTQTDYWTCYGDPNSGQTYKLRNFYTTEQWNFKNGDILEFDILIWSGVNLNSLDGFVVGYMGQPASYMNLLGFKQVANNVFYNNQSAITNGTGGTLFDGNVYYSVYRVTLKANRQNDFAFPIGFPNDTNDFFVWYGSRLNFRLINITQYRLTGEGSPDQQNEINATNDSVQQSENEGNTSQTDTDTATQSLMTAGANIIGALTSAPATDCNINISTTGNSSSFTSAIGNLNLCSDVPSGVLTLVQGMVALVFTPIVLYYVYSILTLIYAQFKEYNS